MAPPEGTDFRKLFHTQLQLPDEELDLGRAALYLAGEQYPSLDVDGYLRQLDRMAEVVRSEIGDTSDQRRLFRALGHHLFERIGFTGNTDDYYNPDNSFLNRVLETLRGIPITLSLVYLETGRRLGLSCYGVGLPGHFLVGLEELDLYLDPFNAGLLLSSADCRRQVEETFGSRLDWQEEFLSPYSKRDILFRMLTNLKATYLQNEDWHSAVGGLQRLTLIDPSLPYLYKELAWCHLNLGERLAAGNCLEMYAQCTGKDPSEVQQEFWSMGTSGPDPHQQSN
jgi:regulator of sirC expression with transglutaminase-like and TPR domain